MSTKSKTVAIALSGGVDSTAAAIQLISQGYTCFGITMYLFDVPDETGRLMPPAFLEDAKRVAKALGIKHHIIDMRETFENEVVQPFAKNYLEGKTPNPCVYCNAEIKYGILLEKALELGADYMATGHYARCLYNEASGEYELYRGLADRKDQAYVMHRLSQSQLSKILFPLGAFESKDDIRNLVKKQGIFTAEKKDSMGICFVPSGDYGGKIAALHPEKVRPGNFVTAKGEVLGQHRGIVYYTIGQKRGLGIITDKPMYVVEICKERNEIVLGTDQDTYASEVYLKRFTCINNDVESVLERDLTIKIFNWGLWLKGRLERVTHVAEGDRPEGIQVEWIKLSFLKPERAPALGQHAVIYDGDKILGGGEICKVMRRTACR